MKIIVIVLISFFFLYSCTKSPETTKIVLSVVTSTNGDSDTKGRVFLTINSDEEYKYVLDNPQHKDRSLGATDSYEFTIEYAMDKIRDITISIESPDAWRMQEFVVQFTSGERYSAKYLANNAKWLSNEEYDMTKLSAKQHYKYNIDMKSFDYKKVPTVYLNSEN